MVLIILFSFQSHFLKLQNKTKTKTKSCRKVWLWVGGREVAVHEDEG